MRRFRRKTGAMVKVGSLNPKIPTVVVSDYRTVVLEVEAESLAEFNDRVVFTSRPEAREIMSGNIHLVGRGKR